MEVGDGLVVRLGIAQRHAQIVAGLRVVRLQGHTLAVGRNGLGELALAYNVGAALKVEGRRAGEVLRGGEDHLRQGRIRQHIGMRHPHIVPFQDLGKPHPVQHLHRKNLLHPGFKAQEPHRLARLEMHDPHPAGALGEPLDQGNTAEDRGLAHLGQPDEGQRPDKIEPAREPRQLGHRAPAARWRSTMPDVPAGL